MLITVDELAKFSGNEKENDQTVQALLQIYIGSAEEIISNYLGFNPAEEYTSDMPALIKLVCLEIASLIQMEERGNLGVNSQSFDGSSRSFLNVVNYDKYLQRLAAYRKVQ